MYDVKSPKAEEFIPHQEILDTLAYAEGKQGKSGVVRCYFRKSCYIWRLNHREAAVLLECPLPEYKESFML